MKLRIKETLEEMISEPRVTGFFFVFVMPSLYIIGEAYKADNVFAYKFAFCVVAAWFIICFLIVRFTLD